MVVAFFNYLVDNGMEVKHITILTFYNGQRKFIIDLLRRHPNLQGEVFNVKTVDSYQGEENQVVVLSLAAQQPVPKHRVPVHRQPRLRSDVSCPARFLYLREREDAVSSQQDLVAGRSDYGTEAAPSGLLPAHYVPEPPQAYVRRR